MNDKIYVIVTASPHTDILNCIKSLINQTYENWEAIIISDVNVFHESFLFAFGIMDERLNFINTESTGLWDARNIAYRYCKSEWVTTLDSKDQFCSNRLFKLYQAAQLTGVATTNVSIIDRNDNVNAKAFNKRACAPHTVSDYEKIDIHLPFLFNKALVSSKWQELPYLDEFLFNLEVMVNANNRAGLIMDQDAQYRTTFMNKYEVDKSKIFTSYMSLVSHIKQGKSSISGSIYEKDILNLIFGRFERLSKYYDDREKIFSTENLTFSN